MSEDILTQINKEKFRRRLLIASRVIAVGLIFAIIYIGVIQYFYARDVALIKEKYGSLGYCYMCGLETYRSCTCQYLDKGISKLDLDKIGEETAFGNAQKCERLNNNMLLSDDVLTQLNFTGGNLNGES